MGLFNKAKKADPLAIETANRYIASHGKISPEEYNKLSEDLIDLAILYWQRHDFESHMTLMRAAEEISFYYQGNKYPHQLVEEIIRDNR